MGSSWSWFEDETSAYQFGSSVNAKEEKNIYKVRPLLKGGGDFTPLIKVYVQRLGSMVTAAALLNIVFHLFRSR